MNDCKDYWCEFYTESNGKCYICKKKDSEKDSSHLHTLLNRKIIEQFKVDEKLGINKNCEQGR